MQFSLHRPSRTTGLRSDLPLPGIDGAAEEEVGQSERLKHVHASPTSIDELSLKLGTKAEAEQEPENARCASHVRTASLVHTV